MIFLNNSLNSLHSNSLEWLSAIEFAKDEAKMIENLIDEHFIDLIAFKSAKWVEDMKHQVVKFQLCNILPTQKLTEAHEERLGLIIEDPEYHNEQKYREEHLELEEDLAYLKTKLSNLKNMILPTILKCTENSKASPILA